MFMVFDDDDDDDGGDGKMYRRKCREEGNYYVLTKQREVTSTMHIQKIMNTYRGNTAIEKRKKRRSPTGK